MEKLEERAKKVEEEVRKVINGIDTKPLLLELIDDVQHLGLTYKFEKDIIKALEKIVSLDENEKHISELYYTALSFRLLRQHGFEVSQGIYL